LSPEAYVKTIVSDLKETYPCMRNSEILAYLSGIEGIREAISEDTLAEWLSGVSFLTNSLADF
jgi:hypothetical protein